MQRLFADSDYCTATRYELERCGQMLRCCDEPRGRLIAAILEHLDAPLWHLVKFGPRDDDGARCVIAVKDADVPGLAAATCQHDVFGWIAAEQTCLVPCCRQVGEEIPHFVGLGEQAFGTVGKMLQGRLEDDGEGEFVGLGGDVRMLRVGEGAGSIVHRANDITREGQRAVVSCSTMGKSAIVVVPFGSIDGLHRHEVGPIG